MPIRDSSDAALALPADSPIDHIVPQKPERGANVNFKIASVIIPNLASLDYLIYLENIRRLILSGLVLYADQCLIVLCL